MAARSSAYSGAFFQTFKFLRKVMDSMCAYDGRVVLCRRCLEQSVDERALAEYLDHYAASLPEMLRVPESVYQNRLAQCAQCSQRMAFTCVACGCYVQARAAKRALRCPIAGEPRWLEYEQ